MPDDSPLHLFPEPEVRREDNSVNTCDKKQIKQQGADLLGLHQFDWVSAGEKNLAHTALVHTWRSERSHQHCWSA